MLLRNLSRIAVAIAVALAFGCEGPAGKDGVDGTNGTSCTVVNEGNGEALLQCTDGTSWTIANGSDGTSCTVIDNGNGTKTISCEDGTTATVADGTNGTNGTKCTVKETAPGVKTITCDDGSSVVVRDGEAGGNVAITEFHGQEWLFNSGEYAAGAKVLVKASILSATADATGLVTVNFKVEDKAARPVLNVAAVQGSVAKLLPPTTTDPVSKWVPYIYRTETLTKAGDWPNPIGTTKYQGSRENNGTLTNNGDGTYRYVFATKLTEATVGGAPITYDRNLTHRVSIMMGGHSGPTADANFDFVPDGTALTTTRDIVRTEMCTSCHGPDFSGHGGDRLTVENCVTCHDTSSFDANGGESIDMKVMIHKIHAGHELATIPGPDGLVFDNVATSDDESADNGSYAIWGNRDSKHTWWTAAFPAVLENCQKCHAAPEGATVKNLNNWKTVPSADACGSCHDDVDFAAGVGHLVVSGGDASCAICHQADGTAGPAPSVTEAHNWTIEDQRNIPEFDPTVTVSTPANGKFFVAGEKPMVTIVLKKNGVAIDHTTIVQDPSAAGEGCLKEACPPSDGLFRASNLMVQGPRGDRKPVLTVASRAFKRSASTGPWDLSAVGAALILKVDQGMDVWAFDKTGGDVLRPGLITVPVTETAFASKAAATTSEIAAWLNANASFNARAIAYEDAGRVAIRSRKLGNVGAIQFQASEVVTQVFGGDLTIKLPGYQAVTSQRTNPVDEDPNVRRIGPSDPGGSRIEYTLDPVDDLRPGTYAVTIEFGDLGRIDFTNYKTPTVGKATFQVKQDAVEKLVADSCDDCHQGQDGRGYVLDYPRHNKQFDNAAVDGCGGCHDYQPTNAVGEWSGGHPISKRVHAVHFGSELNYPLATVAHEEAAETEGRNWRITYPQEIRNCESCHSATGTSGSWKTDAARLPCSGCHDSDAAKTHFKLQTLDPTPADPWSGDERETCQVCH